MIFVLSNHAQERSIQRGIREEWIRKTILNPQKTEIDPINSTALRAWREIPENNNAVLLVVYNPQTNPFVVITVFFDRSMRGKL